MTYFDRVKEIQQFKRPGYDAWTIVCQNSSAYLLALIRNSPITPNQLTIASCIAAIGAGLLILKTDYLSAFLASILVQLSFIIDCGDGQYARYKKMYSPFGPWLDIFCDRIREFVLFMCLVERFSYTNEHAWLWGFYALFILVLYHGEANTKLPFSDEKDKALAREHEKGLIRKIMHLRVKLNIGAFYIGEQYFLISLFLLLNRIDLLFYAFTLYGSIIVFSYPAYKYYHYSLLNKCNQPVQEKNQ